MRCDYDVVSDVRLTPRALEALEGYRVLHPLGGDAPERVAAARRARVYINLATPMGPGDFNGCTELVIARTSGYDHIDLNAAEEAGVCVANQPEVIDEAVAEYAVGGILAALRMIVSGHKYFEDGLWASRGWPRHLMGGLLLGRTVGLLGAGRIGQRVAFMLRLLGAGRVLYHSRTRKPGLEANLGAAFVDLTTLFEESDVLVNSLPLTPETRGLVSEELLLRLPHGAVYVNVGRGATEEPGALVGAASKRPDLYFVVDVHPSEPPRGPEESRYELARSNPRFIATPHFAGYSLESAYATTILAARQAALYLERSCVWNPLTSACRRCREGPPPLASIIEEARLEAANARAR
ncbi:MAG: hypothetical protein LRS49_01840 [Desulfurococcales archaeon]|nr:hypothetical protein [Desulfurococcales archaeon]